MNNLRVAVITELPKEHFPFWDDGLKAALRKLNELYQWDISVYNIPSLDRPNIPDDLDFYLFWGALARPQHERRKFKKQGLLFGGGPTYHPNLQNFDIVFAESKIDLEDFQKHGVKSMQAFGTNTSLFKPMPEMVKVFDYLYPAAFARWKRHDKFVQQTTWANHPKRIALAVGYMQPSGWEKECYEECLKNGVAVMPWISNEALSYLYNMSQAVLITADPDGGCQRAILEAKACNVPVIIESESAKLKELADLTHEQVINAWSETSYAKEIHEGVEGVFNGK